MSKTEALTIRATFASLKFHKQRSVRAPFPSSLQHFNTGAAAIIVPLPSYPILIMLLYKSLRLKDERVKVRLLQLNFKKE